MKCDQYGQIILSEQDLCSLYMVDPNRKIDNCLTSSDIKFDEFLELKKIPNLSKYVEDHVSVSEFDSKMQSNWHMPAEYAEFDIAKWVLDQCKTDEERQRVGEELLLYLDRDLFPLLQYLKYLVDTMRKYNIVWGVGRGSSVSSYVLYLIGVHRINSMYYDLDIHEFLR
jgi:DNA polymerase III alpha subunit